MNHPKNLHFSAVTGTELPHDYINPPDGPKGPVNEAVLLVPLLPGRGEEDADKVVVRRLAKGQPWVVVERIFSDFLRKRQTNINVAEIVKGELDGRAY